MTRPGDHPGDDSGDARDWTPEHEARLRDALRSEAARVQTDPGALAEIRRRTAKPPFWRFPVVAGVAAATAVVAALVVGTLVVIDRPGDDLAADESPSTTVVEPSDTAPTTRPEPTEPELEPSTSASPGKEESPPESPTATASAGVGFEGAMPVYYAATTSDGELKLTREFHRVDTTGDPLTLAVAQMFERPDDPDYVSLWAPTDVESVEVTDDAIVIDLASVPAVTAPDADEPAIEAAVQQLVYTATSAAARLEGTDGQLPVRVLVAGEQPDGLSAVGLDKDLTRTSQLVTRQLVQINDPAEGAEVTSPMAVTGEAAAFEAAIVWEVRDRSGDVVAGGPEQAEVCCEFAEFGFSVDLEPGEYTLFVSDTDPSGGAESNGPVTDTKNFTVVEPD